ncbi:hypothetical protein [Bacillus pumilus]|uniref:hypothetical protein n=1 Tax=Bacillus pumilus TaxID=1408 RepID=UPI00227E5A68|nr:hypothetical protein [Bacillus pumilus]MCY7500125.1 hypothetical protein [Bacillus pumilus]MCY7528551.1 hypothetical protein [Bacillus pumilus]MED4439490.1 hypothetical protein [Bacillus pumilus]MED4489933.1 hypothetical protein [Bacillus pumilus]
MKGNLDELLIQKGVSETHIKEMKETINFGERIFSLYYKEREEILDEIPLSKIKSLGFRGTGCLSWYDHAEGKGSNIDPRRSQIAYKHLLEQTLEQFQVFYKQSPVRLIYFEDDDFYAVNGDGTHRTLWAKITDTPTISAEVTVAYKDHLAYESFKNEYRASFKLKDILHRLMKFAPNKIETVLLSFIRKIIEKEEIHDYGFVRTGFELYYIEKVLSKVDKT